MEQCPNCLNLFPVDELVRHSSLCYLSEVGSASFGGSDGVTATSSSISLAANGLANPPEESDLEQCIYCFKDYSVIELVAHVNVCSKRMKPKVSYVGQMAN